MTRELVAFSEAGKGVVVFREGTITTVEKEAVREIIAGLRFTDVVDFVQLPDGKKTVVVSDEQIENAEMLFGEGATLVDPKDVPVAAESWALPLALPAILARSFGDDTKAWYALAACAEYLEKNAWSDLTAPWRRGLMAATVRAHWKEWRNRGLVSGESYWGWIRTHYFMENGDELWPSVKGRFEGWMRAADVFLRNVENRDWISNLTINAILEIPISKAIRSCGAVAEGLFDFSADARRALLNPEIGSRDMNHIVASLTAHRDKMPQKVIDEETGEIQLIVPATGEIVEEIDPCALDEFVPDVPGEVETIAPSTGTFWTFDYERGAFGYWQDGRWTVALMMADMTDLVASRFVDEIIAKCNIAADYDKE